MVKCHTNPAVLVVFHVPTPPVLYNENVDRDTGTVLQ